MTLDLAPVLFVALTLFVVYATSAVIVFTVGLLARERDVRRTDRALQRGAGWVRR